MAEPRLSRWTPIAVGLSVVSLVAIMVWSQAQQDIDVLRDLRDFDRGVLLPALGLHMLMHVVWATRLRLLSVGFGATLHPLEAWRIATAGQFGGAVTPGRLGSEAMRITLLVRRGSPAAVAGRIVVSDRTMDMVFFLGAGTLGTAMLVQVFGPDAAVLRTATIVALALLLAFMVVLFTALAKPLPLAWTCQRVASAVCRVLRRPVPDVQSKVQELFASIRRGVVDLLRERPLRVGGAIVLSMLIWLVDYGVLWFVLQGFGHMVPFTTVVAAGILLTLLAPVAVTPGGAGVVELGAVVLLGSLVPGLTPAFVLVWRALTYYYDVVIGGVVAAWALRLPRHEAAGQEA